LAPIWAVRQPRPHSRISINASHTLAFSQVQSQNGIGGCDLRLETTNDFRHPPELSMEAIHPSERPSVCNEEATLKDPPPTYVRGLSSIFLRSLIGPAVGTVIGLFIFAIAGLPPLDGISVGGIVGFIVGVLAGGIAWARFPYDPGR
jgi:hypothetical protein